MSISSVKPVLHLFETSVLAVQEDDTDFMKSLKTNILGYLQEKYKYRKSQDLLNAATILNLRFKMNYITEENKDTVKARQTMVRSSSYFKCTTVIVYVSHKLL